MTALVDLHALGLDALLHPGHPAEVTFTWPTGSLAGRTFSSTLAGAPVTVEIAGDTLTVGAPAGVTGALAVGQAVPWELVETTAGDPVVVLTGRWIAAGTPADAADADADAAGQTFTVDLGGHTVEVDVTGARAPAPHRAAAAVDPLAAPDAADDGGPPGSLDGHRADTTAHGNPLAALAQHRADTTAHGDPLGALASHAASLTAHGDPLGRLAAHDAWLHREHVLVPAGWGAHWRSVRGEADARIVKVHMWSDSIGAQGAGATNPRTRSMPGLIEADLHARWGDGGSGFLSCEYATRTGAWSAGAENLFAGCGARAAAPASLRWTDVRGTTLRIFHRNANTTGSFRWRVDGGDWTTVTPPTAFGLEPGLIEVADLADTTHTIDVEWVAGQVVIHGVHGLRAAGVNVARCGQNGRAGSHFSPIILERIPQVGTVNGSTTITTPGAGSFRASMIGRYVAGTGIPVDATVTAVASATQATLSAAATGTGTATVDLQVHRSTWAQAATTTVDPLFAAGLGRADVVIVCLGANDPANSDFNGATFRDGISCIVAAYTSGSAYDYTPDFVFVIEHFADWFDLLSRKGDIAAEIGALATGCGAVLVDMWGMGGRSFRRWSDLGYLADQIHPTDAGHAQYAAPIIDLLAT